jgi:hypothetical protein
MIENIALIVIFLIVVGLGLAWTWFMSRPE